MISIFTSLKIPSNWKVVQLQDVCHKITDGTHKTPNYRDSGIRFISIKNIRPFQPVNWDRYEKFIDPKEHEELVKRCRPQFDDILFPRIGTLGFAKRIDFKEEVSIFVGLGLLKPKKDLILPKYLEYWMNHPLISKLSRERATGSGRLTLPLEQSRLFPVPLAPILEQEMIVAEIEKHFSRLDEAVANLKRVKANLKRYKASVLKAAVEGKLTEDWRKQHPDVEPASKLLERILAGRRAEWSGKGKYKEPTKSDTSNLSSLPEGWAWCAVDQISRKITDGEHLSPICQPAGIPLLSAKDVRDSGVLFDEVKHVSPKDAKRFRMRCDPDCNDILIVSRGATIGRSCAVKTEKMFCLMGSVILIKVCGEIASSYILTALKSVSAVKRLVGVSGSTAQQAIYIQDIRSLPIPLPPYDEQEQIVAEVERRLSVIDELEAAVQANLTRADRLRQAVLSQAFKGNLIQ